MSGENRRVDASRTSPGPAAPARQGPPPALVRQGPPPAPVRASRVRRLAAPVLTLAGAVAAFAYVGAVDPNEPGHYPVCPLFRLTGVLCPGCGGLRSAHAFARGDLVTALGDNAMAVAGYLVFAAFTVLWLVRAFRGGPVPRIALGPAWWWAIGTLALAFTIVRNLPIGSVLAP
ncbi:DUF2752 domain-containing protein [Streptomyces sp. NPDC096033]|uniref:DUF2752 domain-containing protein n=1 Tax=Streptomyces sp. NPDC096033 TaxID=3366071 RepID=UPI00381991AE